MSPRLLRTVASLLFASTALATGTRIAASNTTAVSNACDEIDKALPGLVALPLRDLITFQNELHAYWSQADADYVPTCIVFPHNAQNTSAIVKILNKYESVPFAIKSGGQSKEVPAKRCQEIRFQSLTTSSQQDTIPIRDGPVYRMVFSLQ